MTEKIPIRSLSTEELAQFRNELEGVCARFGVDLSGSNDGGLTVEYWNKDKDILDWELFPPIGLSYQLKASSDEP